jgi:putative nucleotidyltransferase with HDIG domain
MIPGANAVRDALLVSAQDALSLDICMTQYIENIRYPYKSKRTLNSVSSKDKLTDLSKLSQSLVVTASIDKILDLASELIPEMLEIDTCRILLPADDGRFHFHDSMGDLVHEMELLISLDSVSQAISRARKPFAELNNERCLRALGLSTQDSYRLIPLMVNGIVTGALLLIKHNGKMSQGFPNGNDFLIKLIANELGSAIHRTQLNEQLTNSSLEIVLALSKTLETRDPYIGTHSRELAVYSEKVARRLGLSEEETREVCWASLLHDIGKVGIEDQVLHKPGPLTSDEWEIMKTHAEIGAHIVKGISGFENISTMILAHHERMDGKGYPHGLKGNQIPLGSRIIAVVDSYSAMTEGRIYRPPRTHTGAVAELRRFSGEMYDPKVVEVFLQLFDV